MKAKNHSFGTFINKTAIGVFNLDSYSRIINANIVACRITGYPKKNLINKKFTSLVPKNSVKKVTGYFNSLNNKGGLGAEFNLICKNGKEIPVRIDAVQADSNKYLIYCMDVTEQLENEELQLNEEIFLTVIDAMPIPIVITQLSNGKIIYANSKFSHAFDFPAQKMVNRESSEFYVDPNGRRLMIIALSKTGNLKNYEIQVKRDNGVKFWISFSIEPIKFQGKTMLFNSLIDITEQKKVEVALLESEQYLNKSQEMAHFGHWKLNPATGEVEGSDELFNIFGLGRDEANFDAFVEVVHPEDREFDVATIQRGIDYGENWNIKHRLLCRDGTLKWIHAIGEAITDKSGKTVLLLGTVQDITVQKSEDDRKEVINNISRELNKNIEINELGGRIQQELQKVLPAKNIYLSIYDAEINNIQALYLSLDGKPKEKPHNPRILGVELPEYVLKNGKGLMLNGKELDDFRIKESINVHGKKAKSWLGVPLMIDNKAIGVLATFSIHNNNAYKKEDLELLTLIGAQIGSFIERKKAEDARKESEENFRELFENSADEIYLIDPKFFTILNINGCAAKELGYSKEELIGQKLNKITAPGSLKKNMNRLENVINGKPEIFEAVNRRKDGSLYSAEIKTKLVEYGGQEVILALARDITERLEAEEAIRESERNFRELFENTVDEVYLIDIKNTKLINVNSTACMELGYTKENLIGKQLAFISGSPNFKKSNQARLGKVVKGSTEIFEGTQKRKDGSIYPVEIKAKLVDYIGKKAILGIARDITERLQAEEAIRDSQQKWNSLVSNSNDMIVIIDKDEKIQFMNDLPKSVIQTGLSVDKMIGLPFHSFIIKKDIPKAKRELKRVISKKTNATVQVQGAVSNNHYDCRLTPLVKNGKVEGAIMIMNDITEKLKADEALQLSEERYRMLFERNLSGVYRADLDGIIIECNDAFAQILGFESKNEVMGKNARQLYRNLTDKKFHQKLIENKGSLTGYESNIELRDGKKIWVLENASILDDKEGVPKYILGTIIDVTELKEAEIEIENLAKFPEESPNPVFRVDDSTMEIIYSNKAGEEIVDDLTTQEGRLYANFRKAIRKTIEKENSGEAEYWVGNKCFLFNFNTVENQSYINLYSRDITERKRMELMRGTSFRIAEKTNTDDLEFEEICAAIHMELNKVIDAKNFYVALVTNEKNTVSIPYYRDETEPGVNYLPLRISAKGLTEYTLKKGTPRIITSKEMDELSIKGKVDMIGNDCKVWMGVPMRNNNVTIGLLAVQSYTSDFAYNKNDLDLLTFVSGQIANIIQRIRSREELVRNQKKLAHVNQELETFIYKASHDLKGPLCSTEGLVNIAQNEIHDRNALKYIKLIGESIDKAQGILDDLASITVIQQGKSKIEKVDFEKLAIRAIQSFSFHPRYELTKFKVKNNIGKALYTDKKLLDTIMRNLVQNAIKYASNEGNTCTVNVTLEKGKNDSSKISVKDNGIGIPKEYHEKIFDMFFRASEKSSGSGLGLYIAKSAVEKLGGKIKVTSENLRGCEFSFWLPDAK